MKDRIVEHLHYLVGLRLGHIGRASNLVWIGFGEYSTQDDGSGQARMLPEYALHVQCAWRLTQGAEPFLASQDIYVPNPTLVSDETFDWSKVGNSRFDQLVIEFLSSIHDPLVVQAVKADEHGGIIISLSHEVEVQVFPDESRDVEVWRLLQFGGSGWHFVVTGRGCEEV